MTHVSFKNSPNSSVSGCLQRSTVYRCEREAERALHPAAALDAAKCIAHATGANSSEPSVMITDPATTVSRPGVTVLPTVKTTSAVLRRLQSMYLSHLGKL